MESFLGFLGGKVGAGSISTLWSEEKRGVEVLCLALRNLGIAGSSEREDSIVGTGGLNGRYFPGVGG